MKIKTIEIKNFRMLKDFSIDLEEDLSLVIGKNNTGKTSLLTALDKFLNPVEKKKITYDDLNTDLRGELETLIQNVLPSEDNYTPLGIKLSIHIEYDNADDLSSVSELIMSLDPDDRSILLEFSFDLSYSALSELKNDFDPNNEGLATFLKKYLDDYFGPIKKKSISSNNRDRFVDLEKISLSDVISFQHIRAKRAVTNKENDSTLSGQTSEIYRRMSESDEQQEAVSKFKNQLVQTDESLSKIYEGLFRGVIAKVKKFGGIKNEETLISIASTLQDRELLDGNTTVFYQHDKHKLPEDYNGLGYMNLISIIFEIEVLLNKFKRSPQDKPAAINLLFIEEPEAHTHPQMQYVFIKNIKRLLDESRIRSDGVKKIELQTVISTHSSHIVAESDFDEIKYLRKTGNSSVESKNLKALGAEYDENDGVEQQAYKFLKQYLTLNRAELFFADKIILIEGDTERILLPAMMKKIDQDSGDTDSLPLLSQNISIVEVGAHSKTFEKFIDFVGVKTLIITDIDSNYYVEEKVEIEGETKKIRHYFSPNHADATETTNSSLCFFFNKTRDSLSEFLAWEQKDKILSKNNGAWGVDPSGHLSIAYQTKQGDFYARSFEDAFFSLNKALLLVGGHEGFPSLTNKWLKKYAADEIDALEFSERAVGSKPSLAIEILLNSKKDEESGKEFSNWEVPHYIEEGLLWLRER